MGSGPPKRQADMDDALAAEIGERRKKWVERVPGVKVTVVLMASKEMLGESARLGVRQTLSGLIPFLQMIRDWILG